MSVRKSIHSIFLLQFPSLNLRKGFIMEIIYDYVIALGVLGRFHKFRVYVVMISDDKI
jgi:hypothetical protein